VFSQPEAGWVLLAGLKPASVCVASQMPAALFGQGRPGQRSFGRSSPASVLSAGVVRPVDILALLIGLTTITPELTLCELPVCDL
jgi:hypothetical protein